MYELCLLLTRCGMIGCRTIMHQDYYYTQWNYYVMYLDQRCYSASLGKPAPKFSTPTGKNGLLNIFAIELAVKNVSCIPYSFEYKSHFLYQNIAKKVMCNLYTNISSTLHAIQNLLRYFHAIPFYAMAFHMIA